MKPNELEEFFMQMRLDPDHHLGLGDIRLTIAQQEELVAKLKAAQVRNSEEIERKARLFYGFPMGRLA